MQGPSVSYLYEVTAARANAIALDML